MSVTKATKKGRKQTWCEDGELRSQGNPSMANRGKVAKAVTSRIPGKVQPHAASPRPVPKQGQNGIFDIQMSSPWYDYWDATTQQGR